MDPKHQISAGGSKFSTADINFLDGVDDINKHSHGSSSSDTQYSLEFDSDGFSDASKDSKEDTWKPPRRKSRPHRKRRRVSSSIPHILFAEETAPPPAPPDQPPQQPTLATVPQIEALQGANDALKLRVAALEADYTALHIYVGHLAQELQTLKQARGRASPPSDGSRRPPDQSFR